MERGPSGGTDSEAPVVPDLAFTGHVRSVQASKLGGAPTTAAPLVLVERRGLMRDIAGRRAGRFRYTTAIVEGGGERRGGLAVLHGAIKTFLLKIV